MTTNIRRMMVVLAAVVLLPCLAQTASADTAANFGCGFTASDLCSGGPIMGGPPFATQTAIGGLTTNVPTLASEFFDFSFDTGSAGTATLTDVLSGGSDVLNGLIVSGSTYKSTDMFGNSTLTFSVIWDLTGAVNVQNFFSSTPYSGGGFSTVDFAQTGGGVDTVNVSLRPSPVSPVPEPGTIALLGSGLLLCGRLLRKKKEDGDEAAA
jgi:hypothetical protein